MRLRAKKSTKPKNQKLRAHACPKCQHRFKFKAHAQHCACKLCVYCKSDNIHVRDLKTHIRHTHPNIYVKEKLDIFRALRTECINGIKDLQLELENVLTPNDLEAFKLTRGKLSSKDASINVRVTANILRKDINDPLIEGLDTWNAELFENMGQQCKEVDLNTGAFLEGRYLQGTEDNIPFHQSRMLRTRDEEYRRFQMRTCGICYERRWWRNPLINQQPIQQVYIEPLNEDNLYPNQYEKTLLQQEFDQLNLKYERPTYKLTERALNAAHRVHLTSSSNKTYFCKLCSNEKVSKQKNFHWELFNKFNQMIPSPAPKVLRRLNPVERQIIARSAVVMIKHNRLHDTNRKQSRSTGHGCIIRMDTASQINAIRYKLPRHRNDVNVWHIVRKDVDNKPYKVAINIDFILEALDWCIKHNVLFQDLRNTNWRNEDAIADYRKNKHFIVRQYTSTNPHQISSPLEESPCNDHLESNIDLGRSQPGLSENPHNIPTLTPSFDVAEGDFILYDKNVSVDSGGCQYNSIGTECLDPNTCLCKQVYLAVPDGSDQTTSERWHLAFKDDPKTDISHAAANITSYTQSTNQGHPINIKTQKICDINIDGSNAKPHNEWTEDDILAMAFVVEFPFGITSFKTKRHLEQDNLILWTQHLAYLCYKLDKDADVFEHTFQVNPVFVLYIRNRAHRHAVNNDLQFFLQRSSKQRENSIFGMTASQTLNFANGPRRN